MAGPGFKIADGFVEIHGELDQAALERVVRAAVDRVSRAARTVELLTDLDATQISRDLARALRFIPRGSRTIELFTDLDVTQVARDLARAMRFIPRSARTIELFTDVDVTEIARDMARALRFLPRSARTIGLLGEFDAHQIAMALWRATRLIHPAIRTITLNVDLDLSAALAQLIALRGLLAGLNGAGGIGGLGAGAAAAAGPMASLASVIGIAVIAAGALFAALTLIPPVTGLVVAAVGGLSVGMVAAAASGGVLALALKGTTDALKQAITTGKVSAEALAGLTPPARAAVLALTPLHEIIERFARVAQSNFFAPLLNTIKSFILNIRVLEPFVGELAAAMGEFASYVITAFAAPRNIEMFATIISYTAQIMERLGIAFVNSFNAFLRIAESAFPILVKFADKVFELSTNFQEWIVQLDRSGALDQIFLRAMREAKALLDVLGGIIIVSAKFAKALFPGVAEGQATMSGLVAKLDEISAWLDEAGNVTRLRGWVDTFMGGFKSIFDVAGTVVNAFDSIVGFLQENRPVLVGVLAAAGLAAGAFAASMVAAAAPVSVVALKIGAVIAALAALAGAVQWAYENWDTFRDAVDGASAWMRDNLPQIFERVRDAAVQVYELALRPMLDYIRDNGEAYANLGKVLLVVAGVVGGVLLAGFAASAVAIGAATAAVGFLATAATALVAVIYNVVQSWWDLWNRGRDIWGGIIEAIETAIGAVPGLLGGAVEAVENWVAGVSASVGGLATAVAEQVTGGAAAVVGFFQALPGQVAAGLAALPGVLQAAFLAVFDAATYWAGYLVGTVVQFFIDLPGRIGAALSFLWSVVTSAFTSARDAAVSLAVATVENVSSFFSTLPGRVHAGLFAIVGVVSGILDSARASATGLALATVDSVSSFFSTLPGRVGGAISGLWGTVTGQFSRTRDSAVGQAGEMVNSASGVLASMPGRAAAAVAGVAGAVAGALSSAVGAARGIGADIVRGVGAGIESMVGWARGVAQRAAANVVQGFKDALRIGSPSRLMAEQVGLPIPQGIAMGMERGTPEIVHAARELLAQTRRAMATFHATGQFGDDWIFEDFTWEGMSPGFVEGNWNDRLGDLFWPGRTMGTPGFLDWASGTDHEFRVLEGWLEDLIAQHMGGAVSSGLDDTALARFAREFLAAVNAGYEFDEALIHRGPMSAFYRAMHEEVAALWDQVRPWRGDGDNPHQRWDELVDWMSRLAGSLTTSTTQDRQLAQFAREFVGAVEAGYEFDEALIHRGPMSALYQSMRDDVAALWDEVRPWRGAGDDPHQRWRELVEWMRGLAGSASRPSPVLPTSPLRPVSSTVRPGLDPAVAAVAGMPRSGGVTNNYHLTVNVDASEVRTEQALRRLLHDITTSARAVMAAAA